MPLLEIRSISKRFGSLQANDAIDLALEQGEILALLGENGAGKTTLMNILFGHYAADSGSIAINGKVLPPESTDAALKAGVGMVHQHFTLADNLSVLDNIILGTESLWSLSSKIGRARDKLAGIMASLQLDVDLDTLVADLSIGQRQRVEILKALYRDATILILDEPTAVLTPQEVDGLFQLLREMVSNGLSIILISHKLNEVLSIADRIAVLRQGKLVAENSASSINRDELAELIVGRKISRPISKPITPGPPIIVLSDVSVEHADRQSLENIDLDVNRHEILGIAGVAGNGQTALADLLSGISFPDSGTIDFALAPGGKLTATKLALNGAARIPEDRHTSGVIGDMSIWENLMLEDLGSLPCWKSGVILDRTAARERASQLIRAFDIRCASMDMPASLLSGGNMQKVIIARNFRRTPDFILANQPVRGLDEGAIAFVHQQLLNAREAGAGIVLISEDLDELLSLADQVMVIHRGKLSQPMRANLLTPRELGIQMTGGDIPIAAGASNAV
ncbi:MAG: ABC transporter ATP-binding protein [Granulosicoccus sp.]|nr:ABC transporter ATP-binding protein [Granulosicoccus sp.]